MTGIAGLSGSIGGILSAPFIGYLLGLTGSYFIIFLIAGCVYLSAWVVLKVLIPGIHPVSIR